MFDWEQYWWKARGLLHTLQLAQLVSVGSEPWGCEESYGALPCSALPPSLQTHSGGQLGLSLGGLCQTRGQSPCTQPCRPSCEPCSRIRSRWVERWEEVTQSKSSLHYQKILWRFLRDLVGLCFRDSWDFFLEQLFHFDLIPTASHVRDFLFGFFKKPRFLPKVLSIAFLGARQMEYSRNKGGSSALFMSLGEPCIYTQIYRQKF